MSGKYVVAPADAVMILVTIAALMGAATALAFIVSLSV